MKPIACWISLPVLSLLLLAGCTTSRDPATVEYRETQNETVYRAQDISLGTMFPTGGLSRDPSVMLRSWATCSGEDCQPEQVWFSFLIRGSARSHVLTSRDVKIEADENVHTWPEEKQQFAGDLQSSTTQMRIPGSSGNELTRLSMSLSTLRDIAESQSVSGTLGGEQFSLSYEERAALRAMLAKITGSDASSESAPSE